MRSPSDEVKSRADIIEIIASYVPLKKAGANFKGCCPFHNEKTPSFMVSAAKQMWHCFGCGKGGDVFAFLMEREGLEFKEALKLLADRLGVQLPAYDPNIASERTKLLDILAAAETYFKDMLKNAEGKIARDYLTRRGIGQDMIDEFGLGYARDSWDGLLAALRKKFKESDIALAGVIAHKQESNRYYDRFRNRVMIPLKDIHGATVGFTGRLLDSSNPNEAKYLNTPETPVFKKGMILFGLHRAKDAIREAGYTILVEGNFDVIACHAMGMKNTVAPSGTALTTDQLKLLARFASELRICFDADPAGQTAMERGITLARTESMYTKIIQIPVEGGKDPDECIQKNPDLWRVAVANAVEVTEYIFARVLAGVNVDSAKDRARVLERLIPELLLLPSLMEQDHWVKKLARVMHTESRILWEELKKHALPRQKRATAVQAAPGNDRLKSLSERVVELLILTPEALKGLVGAIPNDFFPLGKLRDLYECMKEWYTIHENADPASLRPWIERTVSAPLLASFDALHMEGEDVWAEKTPAEREDELKQCVGELRIYYIQRRRTQLVESMNQAEHDGAREKIIELSRQFQELNQL